MKMRVAAALLLGDCLVAANAFVGQPPPPQRQRPHALSVAVTPPEESSLDTFLAPLRLSSQQQQHHHHQEQPPAVMLTALVDEGEVSASSAAKLVLLSKEDAHPLIRIGTGEKEKIVNAFGLYCAAVSLLTAPLWMAAMGLVQFAHELNPDWDPHRAVYDGTGKAWSKAWLFLVRSYPTVSGDVERVGGAGGPCLYVANHASWLDIPVLCTVLDPVFKFIAKGELRKVPCIGQQLEGVSIQLYVYIYRNIDGANERALGNCRRIP
jgi:hypothetical protein